jgi:hypothetical protein
MSLSDAHYFEEMGVKKYEEIRPLLDSRDKVLVHRACVSCMCVGLDAEVRKFCASACLPALVARTRALILLTLVARIFRVRAHPSCCV